MERAARGCAVAALVLSAAAQASAQAGLGSLSSSPTRDFRDEPAEPWLNESPLRASWELGDRWALGAAQLAPADSPLSAVRERGVRDSQLAWRASELVWLHARWSALRAPQASLRELNEELWELSGSYARPVAEGSAWRMSLALARKERGLQRLDAAAFELALSPRESWMTFARVEALKWNRLGRLPRAPSRYVARLSLGALRALEPRENLHVGVGLAYTRDWSPTSFERPFRGEPHAVMAFVRVATP